MHRQGLRANIGGVLTDVPTGTWAGGQFLRYNASTGLIDSAAGGGGGGITGPGSSVVGDIVTWNDTGGTTVANGGKQASALVTGPPTVVSNRLAQFSGTSGTVLVDSGIPSVNAVTNIAGTAVVANVSQFTNTIGNDISDSGLPVAQIPRATSVTGGGALVACSATSPITYNTSSTLTTANVVANTTGVGSTDNVASYASAGGVRIKDSGKSSQSLVQGPIVAVVSGDVVSFNGTGGTSGSTVQDAGFLAADVVRQTNVSVINGNLASYNGTTGRIILDSLIPGSQVKPTVSTSLAVDSALITTTVTTVLTLAIPSAGTWDYTIIGNASISTLATNNVTYQVAYPSITANGFSALAESFTSTTNASAAFGFAIATATPIVFAHANAINALFPIKITGHVVASAAGSLTLGIARATGGAVLLRAGTNAYAVKVA